MRIVHGEVIDGDATGGKGRARRVDKGDGVVIQEEQIVHLPPEEHNFTGGFIKDWPSVRRNRLFWRSHRSTGCSRSNASVLRIWDTGGGGWCRSRGRCWDGKRACILSIKPSKASRSGVQASEFWDPVKPIPFQQTTHVPSLRAKKYPSFHTNHECHALCTYPGTAIFHVIFMKHGRPARPIILENL
jgi:hypothetical protein